MKNHLFVGMIASCFMLILLAMPASEVRAAIITSQFYPTTGSGIVENTILGSGWATSSWESVRNAATGRMSGYTVGAWKNTTEYEGYSIQRGFLPFDTSSIPDDAIIVSATLKLYPSGRSTTDNNQYTYIQPIGPATPASYTSLSTADFDQTGSTPWSDTKNTYSDTWTNGVLVSFPLNEQGLGGVSKTSYTAMTVREGHDIDNVPPISAGYYNRWDYTAGSSYLEVIYGAN